MIEKKEATVSNSKWEIVFPTGLVEEDYFTAVQNNQDVLSDEVKRVLPPLEAKINPTSSGENVHPEGTGIPNYWIHMKVENPTGGGEMDTFQVGEDGNWRRLNAIPNLPQKAKITVRQSKTEFDDETKQSKPVSITVS
ncbi:hypothetical protein DLn1_00021 [Bacillus phage DLn1]|nr:hypothetical protein DLn1_00021 [Bacillus phage DLn1]